MIYLDWAATTPLCSEAVQAMAEALRPGIEGLEQGNANANSLYRCGRSAFKSLEKARLEIAGAIGARGDELFFTSGATEADNAALFGMVDALMLQRDCENEQDCVPTVIVSSIEHDAVLKAAKTLNQWGARIVYVDPDRTGHVTLEALEAAIDNSTILVSIMAVNNEIGSVMDIKALAKVAHDHGALFHTDATQAFGKIPIQVKDWGVDALSLSSHKICGPKGVGALYLKVRTPFSPQLVGGGQELGKRSGTQNVPGILGFAAAVKKVSAQLKEQTTALRELRDYCYKELVSLQGVEPTVVIEPGSKEYAPHIVNVLVEGFESETLILQLDNRGICISGGSACSSHSLDPSHVLSALHIGRDKALGSLRVSMGYLTTKEDIDTFLESLKAVIA